MKKHETPAGKLGLEFANALVAGNFQAAHSKLSSDLKKRLSPEGMKREFEEMTSSL